MNLAIMKVRPQSACKNLNMIVSRDSGKTR